MAKKVFLQKGRKGGGRSPYVKYLLLAALGLILLVIVTPYLLQQKGKESTRKLGAEKVVVKKELPKPPEPAPGEISSGEGLPGGLAAKPEAAPEPPKPPEPPPAPKVEPPPPPQAVQPPAEPAPKDLFPKSPSLTQAVPPPAPVHGKREQAAPPPAAVKGKQDQAPPARAGTPAPEMKPAKQVAAGSQTYAVQVGCFREKQGAEEVRRTLQQKGYDVVVCPSSAVGGSYAFAVVTRPVASMSKAATLAEQIKSVPKTSPTIIKMPPACGVDGGAPAPATAKKAAKPAAVSKSELKPTFGPMSQESKKPAATAKKKASPAAKVTPASATKPNSGTATKPKPAVAAKTKPGATAKPKAPTTTKPQTTAPAGGVGTQ
ncbi:MAG: SPOR domain-containing protein [Syntrophobacteraceae bacterium]